MRSWDGSDRVLTTGAHVLGVGLGGEAAEADAGSRRAQPDTAQRVASIHGAPYFAAAGGGSDTGASTTTFQAPSACFCQTTT